MANSDKTNDLLKMLYLRNSLIDRYAIGNMFLLLTTSVAIIIVSIGLLQSANAPALNALATTSNVIVANQALNSLYQNLLIPLLAVWVTILIGWIFFGLALRKAVRYHNELIELEEKYTIPNPKRKHNLFKELFGA